MIVSIARLLTVVPPVVCSMRVVLSFLALGISLIQSNFVRAADPAPSKIPQELQGIGIREKLGDTVAIDQLTFRNEKGENVRLSSFFGTQKPVILSLVYYKCPNLCGFLLNGFLDTLKTSSWEIGKQFEVLSVSINPNEGAELARDKKATYLKELGKPGAENGWHFLTGTEDQIRKLADQVGFQYRYDPVQKEYAHSAALFVLTPTGKISRYLYGITFPEKTLKLALLEASNGKVGTIVDRFVMFCFRYDASARGYVLFASRLMKWGAGLMVLLMAAYFFRFWKQQRWLKQTTMKQARA